MNKLTNDIQITNDKYGLVLTTARQTLHITTRNGVPHVWFIETQPSPWQGCDPTTMIHGLTPDGGFFTGRFSKDETLDHVFEQYEKEWTEDIFQFGNLSYRERSELWLEHLEKTNPDAIEKWINDQIPFAQKEYDEIQKAHASQKRREEFVASHPVGTVVALNGRTFVVTEYSDYRGFTLAPILSDGALGKRTQVWYYSDLEKALNPTQEVAE